MPYKSKILVALALIVAAVYILEIVLTVANQGLNGPALVKAGLVIALLYYSVQKILKAKQSGSAKPSCSMRVEEAEQRFREFLAKNGNSVEMLTPKEGINLAIDFYRTTRAVDALTADDKAFGDGLLYQWGVYDWGKGENFEVDLTRQFILVGEEDDDAIRQFSLTFFYQPTEEFRAIKPSNLWCWSVNGLPSFQKFIVDSEAFSKVHNLKPLRVELHFGEV